MSRRGTTRPGWLSLALRFVTNRCAARVTIAMVMDATTTAMIGAIMVTDVETVIAAES